MRLLPRTSAEWFGLAVRMFVPLLVIAMFLPISTKMPGRSHTGSQPSPSAAEQRTLERLRGDVRVLAGEIGERNVWHEAALQTAARHIEGAFSEAGLQPERQIFEARGVTVANIFAIKEGVSTADEVVVVGGHYDSVPGSPGANDNGSGVAAVLELARLLADVPMARTVHFVAFVNEEPPFFRSEEMGSFVYAAALKKRRVKVTAMLSLETIGYYSETPGSQRFPFPLGFFYPDTGNFIGFVANTDSKALLERTITTFRNTAPMPSEGVAAPSWIQGIDWSDQWSFWEHGYPALMVTDTAPFRYPHYHSALDRPDKITYEPFARVVTGLAAVVRELAGDGKG